jgi:hypothetical protein
MWNFSGLPGRARKVAYMGTDGDEAGLRDPWDVSRRASKFHAPHISGSVSLRLWGLGLVTNLCICLIIFCDNRQTQAETRLPLQRGSNRESHWLHSFKNYRIQSLSYLFNISYEEIFLNIRGSFMDRFKLHKTKIKVYIHKASKIWVIIQILSYVWLYKETTSYELSFFAFL